MMTLEKLTNKYIYKTYILIRYKTSYKRRAFSARYKRIINQWDLQHLTFDLKELKEKIKNITKIIRYKERWLAAFDYFLIHA
jgi:hypothetical protein